MEVDACRAREAMDSKDKRPGGWHACKPKSKSRNGCAVRTGEQIRMPLSSSYVSPHWR